MLFFRPLPRWLTRPVSILVLVTWVVEMGRLVDKAYLQASPLALSADLSRYGSSAQWKGVYSRGEKIGFVVTQTTPTTDGYEIHEDGQLQMVLLGDSSGARIHTSALVDRAFALRSFAFSLNPGTGAIEVKGSVEGSRIRLTIRTPSGERSETRYLPEPPLLSLNLPRRLVTEGLSAGKTLQVSVFDPATLRNAPMTLHVEQREVVTAADRPIPAFRVRTDFSGITTTSWVTDLGEVVREESPLGFIMVKETRARATALAVPGSVQTDMLRAAAVVPKGRWRIDDGRFVARLRLRLEGFPLDTADLQGAGQTVEGNVFEIRDSMTLKPTAADPGAPAFLAPEPFLESDAPEIRAEAQKAAQGATDPKVRAERLVRYVNALLDKRPTVSLPSAREVLRTRVGDCNEHTALYVAMARSLGLPARIAVGLVALHGAFYYHAWAEVYLADGPERGLWLPVDPTLNQFPADATHLRLARGGLDRQVAILPSIGHARMTVLDVDFKPGAAPILVGRARSDIRPMEIAIPHLGGDGRTCWSSPPR